MPDPSVPYEDTVGAFAELQQAGRVRHIGVSNVTLEQLALARSLCTVVSVQNAYNAGTRTSENLLAACEETGMAFLPWKPIQLEGTPAAVAAGEIAAERGITSQQVALAWVLGPLYRRCCQSPAPRTNSSIISDHLRQLHVIHARHRRGQLRQVRVVHETFPQLVRHAHQLGGHQCGKRTRQRREQLEIRAPGGDDRIDKTVDSLLHRRVEMLHA